VKIANRNYRVRDGWKLNSTEGRRTQANVPQTLERLAACG